MPYHWAINMDDNYFYFLNGVTCKSSFCDTFTANIGRIDKTTGNEQSFSITVPQNVSDLFLGGDYLYLYNRNQTTLFRTSKTDIHDPEQVISFEYSIKSLKADGNKLYATTNSAGNTVSGLFVFDISTDSLSNLINQNITWFDFDHENIYCVSSNVETREQKIYKISKNESSPTPVELSIGKWNYNFFLSDDFIYYWSDDDSIKLMRISKNGGVPEFVMTNPDSCSYDDDAFTIVDNNLFWTNLYGQLWTISLNNPSEKAVMLAQRGPYDDDDYSEWIIGNGNVLYWIAGPEIGVRAQDEDKIGVFKTILKRSPSND